MSYVDKILLPNERVIRIGRIHWMIFARNVVLVLVCSVIFFIILNKDSVNRDDSSGLSIVALFCLIGGIYGLYKMITDSIFMIFTELALTSSRVVVKFGLFRRKAMELHYKQVESINFSQGVFGRIFNFGSVWINGTGGKSAPIPFVDNPLAFKKKAAELIINIQEQ